MFNEPQARKATAAMNLAQAPISTALRVTDIKSQNESDIIGRRLMELGFIRDAVIEVHHEAPLMKDPIAVLVRGMIVALRRYEAEQITVELANVEKK